MTTDLPQIIAYPMHGETKLRREGLRTRDAHILEHLATTLLRDVTVVSRPEPFPRVTTSRFRKPDQATASLLTLTNTVSRQVSPFRLRLPLRRWWIESTRFYPLPRPTTNVAVVCWNPIIAAEFARRGLVPERAVFDLLDDWTRHPSFAAIRTEVEQAYELALRCWPTVVANAPGTMELASRFGRDDAHLITNGVDREKFSLTSSASGPLTIGYGGKISSRLDVDLLRRIRAARPKWEIRVCGPIIEQQVFEQLRGINGIRYLGDLKYEEYVEEIRSWDIAIVPHRVGDGEIGGDVIKIYEYRAAGIVTVSTDISGAGNVGLSPGLLIGTSADFVTLLDRACADFGQDGRIARVPHEIADAHTWLAKARVMNTFLS